MGLLEELAGAAAAVVATEKLDPGASLLTEGLAAVAGFKGAEALAEQLEKSREASAPAADPADPAA
ncbi:MAG: hypothetical protein JOY84_09655 [Curvibacter sp.]|nr:hypothetical protein [Curvibacter sp.]